MRYSVVLVLGVVAGFALAQPDGIERGKVKKIDLDKLTITLTQDGKDRELAITEETRVLGAEGKSLKERFADIKEGKAGITAKPWIVRAP